MFLYCKNNARGDIFKEKGISDFVKIKNPTMIQLNRMYTINQSKTKSYCNYWNLKHHSAWKKNYWRHTIKQGMPEHGTPAEQRSNWALLGTPSEHPRIPKEYQRNTSGTHPEQRNHTKQRTSVVFLRENSNFKNLNVETLFIADINYLFLFNYGWFTRS